MASYTVTWPSPAWHAACTVLRATASVAASYTDERKGSSACVFVEEFGSLTYDKQDFQLIDPFY